MSDLLQLVVSEGAADLHLRVNVPPVIRLHGILHKVDGPPLAPEDKAAIDAQWETTVDGHAGEKETSAIMVIRPDLVHRDQLRSDGEGNPRGDQKGLRDAGINTGIWWYADHPTHYRGDGTPATAEKGERWLQAMSRAMAGAIRRIKDDNETLRLQNEFYAAHKHGDRG